MEKSILLTLLLIVISLGKKGKRCIIRWCEYFPSVKCNLKNDLSIWTVKFVEEKLYL
ncbi:hypothetical protein [Falsiporphyromonas endometrii]|uniref:Uncharacterized protein n=1 Tax=Falsiporphyromonas endometrii TaxID=1387297 RepID=A0ABV9K7W3_9PORP